MTPRCHATLRKKERRKQATVRNAHRQREKVTHLGACDEALLT